MQPPAHRDWWLMGVTLVICKHKIDCCLFGAVSSGFFSIQHLLVVLASSWRLVSIVASYSLEHNIIANLDVLQWMPMINDVKFGNWSHICSSSENVRKRWICFHPLKEFSVLWDTILDWNSSFSYIVTKMFKNHP